MEGQRGNFEMNTQEAVDGLGRKGKGRLTCLIKSWANLSCSWMHFSSSARKKLKWRERTRGGSHTVLFLHDEIKEKDSFLLKPYLRRSCTEEDWTVPGPRNQPPKTLGHTTLTPYASHKSGEYSQTRFYPSRAYPRGHPFLLFSS